MNITPYFDFLKNEEDIKYYDFILFYDDNFNFDDNQIIEYTKFMINNKLDQFILNNSENISSNNSEYNYYKKIIKSNRIFKDLKKEDLIQKNEVNEYKPLEYIIQPSIIKTNKFFLYNSNCNLKKNPHIENIYWKELIKNNFKISSNFNNDDTNLISSRIIDKINNSFGILILNKNNNRKKYYKFLKIHLKNFELPYYNNDSGDNLTIVTGFLDIKINRPAKSNTVNQIYNYIEKSRETLKIPQFMVIYCSEELIENITKIRKEYGLLNITKIIKITLKDNLYMIDKIDIIRENVKKNNPPYNIAEYILAVNSRYSYIEDAIKNNYFNTDYFAWVDFSASHIVTFPPNKKITYSSHDKIRIGWIARHSNNQFIYNHHCLGGGIFVGYKEIMLELIKIHHKEFIKLMEMGYNINDDKLLFIIKEQNPYLFDTYYSDYKNLFIKL
jgi:hypothetical protein